MIDTHEIMKIGLNLAGWKVVPADSGIHVEGTKIKKILLTIDVTVADLIIAKDIGCDAVITHHPIGFTALNFHRVFDRHVEYMVQKGIPRKLALAAVKKLKERSRIKSHGLIYQQLVDEARLLQLSLVNIHQPCDEYMRKTIYRNIILGKTEYVSDIIASVNKIPEFKNAITKIKVCQGRPHNKAGRWVLAIAAGTNGGFHIAKEYFRHNIKTVIYLHIDYNDLMKIKEQNLLGNLVILGHLAGDSIGLNALSDKLEEKGIKVVKMGLLPHHTGSRA
jgi:putative NIF3 family GTP cyclohydrolase 1 type 2